MKANNLNFRVAVSGDRAEILLYDIIGEDIFGGVGAKQFAAELANAKAAKTIDLRINSPGGDAFVAFTMYNLLKSQRAEINVFIDGLAASAASVVAMAGDTIEIAKNGMLMIHRAWTVVAGNAADFHRQAATLEKVDESIVNIYADQTGGDTAGLLEQMSAETWLNAADALEQGFVDRIGQQQAVAACIRADLFNYKHIPPELLVAEPVEAEAIPYHQQLRQDLATFPRTPSTRMRGHYGHAS